MPYGTSLYGTGGYEDPTYEEAVDTLPTPLFDWRLGEASQPFVDRKGNYPRDLITDSAVAGQPGIVMNNGGATSVDTGAGPVYDDIGVGPARTEATWAWVAWCKADSLSAAMEVANWDNGFPEQFCGIEIDATGHAFAWMRGASGNYYLATASAALSTATTYMLMARFDGTTLALLVNGVSTATATPGEATDAAKHPVVLIGSAADALKPFDGVIQRVSWFATAITDAKALAMYNAGILANLSRTATDGLGLSDAVSRTTTRARSVAEGLGLSDAAVRGAVTRPRTATDTLTLADAATRAALSKSRTATDGLGLSDAAAVTAISTHLTATDGLGLSDIATADVGGLLQRGATDALHLSDVATARVSLHCAATDVLHLTDSASTGAPGAGTSVGSAFALMFYGR